MEMEENRDYFSGINGNWNIAKDFQRPGMGMRTKSWEWKRMGTQKSFRHIYSIKYAVVAFKLMYGAEPALACAGPWITPSLPSPPLPFFFLLPSPPLPLPFPLPLLPLPLRSRAPLMQLGDLGERCKLPQRGLIWCILALKYDIWWQQF